jgi:histidinol-phosphate aminotransferase
MTDPITLIRPSVLALQPYSSARDDFKGNAQVFLDANESPFNTGLNRYPDPWQRDLKARFSVMKGLPTDMMLLGNGSDEVIDLLFRVFCEPGVHNAVVLPPTYGMYAVSAAINQVPIRQVPLDDAFQPDVAAIEAAVDVNTRLVFVCSPNNPTGNLIPLETIAALCALPVMVVVDEAYVDFADAGSALTLMSDYSNLVVMQTLSKAWGLAAIRLGMCFAQPAVIAVMNKVKPPYNVNALTQQVALRALDNEEQMMSWVAAIKAQREVLPSVLETLPVVDTVFPSDANFLLVRFHGDATALYHRLTEHGIVVRDRSSQPGCSGCLRITIGTMEENLKLIEVLRLIVMS